MHMYYKELTAPIAPDLNAHIRALIVEAQLGSGIDVWLSIHMGDAMSMEDQRAFIASLPRHYSNRVITFDSARLFGRYVKHATKLMRLIRHGGLSVRLLQRMVSDMRLTNLSTV